MAADVGFGAYKGAKAIKNMAKAYSQMNKTKSNKSFGGGNTANVTTVQQDVKTTGSRKPNRRKLKKQRRFRNKIENALAPRATHHTYVETQGATVNIQTVARATQIPHQYTSTLASEITVLNGGTDNPTGITYLKDNLHNLAGQATTVSLGAQTGSKADQKELTVLKSTLELSLTNNSVIALVFDVYWCVATTTHDSATHATPLASWEFFLAENNYLTASGGRQQLTTDNGVTPDCAVGWGKYWKILKKHRVYLQSAATSEFKFSGGAYRYKPQKFVNMSTVAGRTKGVMIVGAIGDNTGLPNAVSQPVFRYHTTRKYRVMYPHGKDQIPNVPTNTLRVA